MTGHNLDQDDVLKDLDAVLRVEPSRAFAEAVRARVTRAQGRARTTWWGLAAAAGLGLTTLVLWRPAPEPIPVVRNEAPVSQSAPAVAPTPVPVTTTAAAEPVRRSTRRIGPVVAPVTQSGVASEPRYEVITNQGAVLRALWAEYERRPVALTEGEAAEGAATASIAVAEIVVAPIVVAEIGKEPGRGGATPIIRRASATKETR